MFPQVKNPKKLIYLDHAATTALDPAVKKAMEPFWIDRFGNPSSIYGKGREAKLAIDQSRKAIAELINCRTSEIVFTAGGTESVNLAIFGVARNFQNTSKKHFHFICSAIEHHCVINSFKALVGERYRTTLVGVDPRGFIKLDELKKAIRPETVFISLMLANNEIGTILQVAEVGKWLKGLNKQRLAKGQPKIVFHSNACQAAGYMNLDVERLGVDLMSVNGSKVYGPKQTGFLYIRNGVNIRPLIYGGGQEKGLRSGTENVAGIVGLAKALEVSDQKKESENLRIKFLSDYLLKNLRKNIKGLLLNGYEEAPLKAIKFNYLKLPNIVNISIDGIEGETLMLYLDSYGIACSTASACSTGSVEPSHVLLAIGRSKRQAQSSLRLSLGRGTYKSEIEYAIKILAQLVRELRKVKN